MKQRRGITLIEVLLVIAIGGLFLSSTAVNVNTQLAKGRDGRRKTDLDKMYKTIEDYYDSTGCFPQSIPACGNPLVLKNTTLLSAIPCDPKYAPLSYHYVSDATTCGQWFKLYAKLEYTKDEDIDRMGCRYGCGPNCQYNYGRASSNVRVDACPAPTVTSPIQSPTISDLSPTATPALDVSPTPTPTPVPLLYVCAPGGGQEGSCEVFKYPEMSDCPKVYPNDPTCQNECDNRDNRCLNSRGKSKPF